MHILRLVLMPLWRLRVWVDGGALFVATKIAHLQQQILNPSPTIATRAIGGRFAISFPTSLATRAVKAMGMRYVMQGSIQHRSVRKSMKMAAPAELRCSYCDYERLLGDVMPVGNLLMGYKPHLLRLKNCLGRPAQEGKDKPPGVTACGVCR